MADVLVRNLDRRVVERLKRRARRNGRSLQGEVRSILTGSADEPRLDRQAASRLLAAFRGQHVKRRGASGRSGRRP